jgi:hypothetical protein
MGAIIDGPVSRDKRSIRAHNTMTCGLDAGYCWRRTPGASVCVVVQLDVRVRSQVHAELEAEVAVLRLHEVEVRIPVVQRPRVSVRMWSVNSLVT